MYNGHRTRNCWNVNLWINNDEGLYRLACEAVRRHRTKPQAAQWVLDTLHDSGITETPDGVRYSRSAILFALRGI